jgi:tetratricopeptide (TPR) repeat protein
VTLPTSGTSSNLAVSYLGIVHAEYYFYLTTLTDSQFPLGPSASPISVAHLVSLLLASRTYSNLSAYLQRNTPNGYLTAANVELELFNFANKGYLSLSSATNSVDTLTDNRRSSALEALTTIERNMLKAIELNHHLELLSEQGVPIQDTIDLYSAFNQLGLLYTQFCEHQNLTSEDRTKYFTLAREAFEEAIALNTQRYEAKVNLASLYSNIGSMGEAALRLFDEVMSSLLTQPHSEVSEDSSRPTEENKRLPASLWNNRGNIEERMGRLDDAMRSYQMALESFEAAMVSGGPAYDTISKNLKRMKEVVGGGQ